MKDKTECKPHCTECGAELYMRLVSAGGKAAPTGYNIASYAEYKNYNKCGDHQMIEHYVCPNRVFQSGWFKKEDRHTNYTKEIEGKTYEVEYFYSYI